MEKPEIDTKSRAKKETKIIKIMAFIEFLIIILIFVLFYLSQPVKSNRVIYIPKGNLNYTIKSLQNRGLDILKFDKVFFYLLGKPQAGWIDLKTTQMSKLDFLYKLTTSKAALKRITIIPGETNYFIFKQISKKMDLKNFSCPFDEGFLKPETYLLPLGMSKKGVCNYLYNYSIKWHRAISEKIFGYYDYQKYKKYLIIASIIQKEAASTSEMPFISAVIYNRLKKHMKLQMDGALNYGSFSHTKVTHKRIKRDRSHYNTYKFYGLPEEPVCVVSQDAILAAIYPAKVEYLYFVRCGNHHIFAASYKAHLRNIRRKCK